MNDIIEIKDNFLIDDSHSKIRGFVSAYDENGNRLFLKENMIVKDGRKLIMNSLKNGDSIFSAGSDSNDGLYAFVGSETSFTKPEHQYSDMFPEETGIAPKNIKVNIIAIKTNEEINRNEGTDYTEPFIRIEFEVKTGDVSSLSGTRLGSLGLFYKKTVEATPEYTLLSRVTFPPYSQSATLKFKYYIYF